MQKHKYSYEIIIVDDGSSDNIDDVVFQFADKLPIRFFKTGRKGYLSPTYPINCGIKQAYGEHIMYGSPEIIHIGNTFDCLHEILSENDTLVCLPVFALLEEDNEWLIKNNEWVMFPQLAVKRFQDRVLMNMHEGHYYLGGWRKSSFIELGGMDEDFVYLGCDDDVFLERWKYFGKSCSMTTDFPFSKHLIGFHQWHKRDWLDDMGRRQELLHSDSVAKRLKKEMVKTHRYGPIKLKTANEGKEWGLLPPNAEINLGNDSVLLRARNLCATNNSV